MFSKSNLLATVAATVVMFLLGYLIWGVATVDFFESHTITNAMKDPVDFTYIILGNLLGSFALSTLYGKWARGHHSAKEGAEFGIWIGVFVGLGMGLLWYGTSTMMDLTGHLAEAVLDIVFYLIIGTVIALVYKATSKAKS